ncbi:hypothetical protein GCM10027084_22090 [Pseudoxanthomonas sangjuensis]
MKLQLADAEATERLGRALAGTRPVPAVVYLQGDLGAGKSTLARALLRALGVRGAIRSPTYTLVERYPIEGGEAWHLDLYRLADAGELDFLGLDEGIATLWLVEWPEKGGHGLPAPDLRVVLAVQGQGRSAELDGVSAAGRDWLSRLERRRHELQSVYEAAGGAEGLHRLAEAWHRRVVDDEIVGHAFSHGFHPQHTERLAAYWIEALGGPAVYSENHGDETSVVRMHSGNGVHEEMDRRAIACFDRALDDVGIASGPLRQVLHDYFAWATTTTMARYPGSAADVPCGLAIPRWSWGGLQG